MCPRTTARRKKKESNNNSMSGSNDAAAGTGGMVCLDDDALVDRCLMLRRWGRRSEPQLFGSRKGKGDRFFSDLDGLEYDNLFIFDEVGWNFEPSELSAAFGVVQMRKLPTNLERRKRNFDLLCERLERHPDHFVLPRTTPGIDSTGTRWFSPSTTNIVQIRSSTVSVFSATSRRTPSPLRLRRMRTFGY